ncbi:hypothetical protein B0H11DRAFT_834177 [Mycena galericulata]|nr:hypothetical protein B0H11DRAFT_834177 [Mycena galericulata]
MKPGCRTAVITRRVMSVPIVPKSVQGYSDLLLHRKLRMIGIVRKDRVGLEGSDECIKCEGANSEILPEMVWATSFERHEDVVKVRWATREGVARLLIPVLIHAVYLGPYPTTKEGRPLIIQIRVFTVLVIPFCPGGRIPVGGRIRIRIGVRRIRANGEKFWHGGQCA